MKTFFKVCEWIEIAVGAIILIAASGMVVYLMIYGGPK